MKNSLCKHCAFIAAVFAVCLFVTSCNNPVNPGQKPNPEPAPSPAPQPAPAPSIEVPAPPQAPSAEGGATVQLPALPPTEEPVETENVTVTLKSVSSGSGILPNFGTQAVIVPVSKKLGATQKAEKVKELLLYKLAADGYSSCEFCGANDGTGSASFTEGSTIYVKKL